MVCERGKWVWCVKKGSGCVWCVKQGVYVGVRLYIHPHILYPPPHILITCHHWQLIGGEEHFMLQKVFKYDCLCILCVCVCMCVYVYVCVVCVEVCVEV